jgi:hypothetical protein
MNGFRVTKYDPQLRDARGRYVAEDWTSISDVGKYFGGTEFTQAAYLAVEARYLAAVELFARDSAAHRLRLCELESGKGAEALEYVKDGNWLTIEQSLEVAKCVLREEFWCKLELEGQFLVHFGYDYYMYIGSQSACDDAVEGARALGLFVEENFASPYGLTGADDEHHE